MLSPLLMPAVRRSGKKRRNSRTKQTESADSTLILTISLLGPVGLLAGLSAKNKSTVTVAVRFKDGKNSLLEMDDKVYKNFVRAMF